jgi:hypothetical protein
MAYSIPTGVPRGAVIRCYRSAATTTGTSGTFVNVSWDAESATPAKFGITHSTSSNPEQIVCARAGDYDLVGAIKLAGGTWDEIRASVEVGGVAKHTPNGGASSGLLGLTSGPGMLVLACTLRLAVGDVVRVRVASVGQANVMLDVGETDTWLELRQVSF